MGGVAIIIGKETGRILWVGIRNKFCYICNSAENKHEIAPPHICFKNWTESSQAMEGDIIVEGFQKSEQMHGVRYMWLVADGDSSVFARIKEEVPIWGVDVSKIECANHICKCLRSNLEKLAETNGIYKGKNNLTKAKRIRIVSAVRCAIRMRSKQDDKQLAVKQLEKDIRNSVYHVFGIHTNCSDFCKGKTMNEPNCEEKTIEGNDACHVCEEQSAFWEEGSSLADQERARYSETYNYSDVHVNLFKDVSAILDRVANKSPRLIENTTTNLAECWMHMRTKLDGGKVYNLCNRGSWHTRCYGATLRMNLGAKWSPIAWRKATGTSAGEHFVDFYEKYDKELKSSNASKKRPEAAAQRWKRKVTAVKESTSKSARSSYGPEAVEVQPDVPASVLQTKMGSYEDKHINISDEKIAAIENITKTQSSSQVWHEERRKRITSSIFGSVIKRKTNIPVKNLMKQLLYTTFKGNRHTATGLQQERVTIQEYVLKNAEEGNNVQVKPSGLVICKEEKFLGGSPDGIVIKDSKPCGLIEIKNVLHNKPINLNEAAKTNKNFCLEIQSNCLKLKQNHNYYYQCQGLLHICNMPWIDFVVRTCNPYQLHIERIEKDNNEWDRWLPKLRAFYFSALLPELCCPRYGKVPGIREPGVWVRMKQKHYFHYILL